ncbi:Zn(II)2Cys6 transcriptional activator [Westerdykella ornata]|uniref:Zn(II)2Cys6 transcriptional activator n=1 Tax=Westerdykella ornata TaxID=318751 RepID=A0A6A6JRB8_WESOR|nr:Zn(II)2Cys6 transcriptional activator [Westerdykella ornata]KAF2278927.1 Zn(II)2Cys6 transcriptional activator [Westerdykella ornata]
MSPTTPGTQSTQQLSYIASPTSARSNVFKRPASSDDEAENGENGRQAQSRRTAVVKRACNECRQQKLKCNVQQEPFKACDRCVKQRLRCVIEPNFKRVGKRNRNAEMEKEMEQLRERLAMYEGRGALLPQQASTASNGGNGYGQTSDERDAKDAYLQSQHQQVATSLLDLRSGSPMFVSLGTEPNDVKITPAQATDLFDEFFTHYHPFLPFLEPTRSPDDVYSKDSKLLFWAIISVAARHYQGDTSLLKRLKEPLTDEIWRTIKTQPNHHVVKALCLLCTWPLPARTTVSDPTFMLCGVMMQIAMQIGLHQPTHPQDFSRTKVQLEKEDINDRLRTWAVCNIVAQTVSTGYGQPSITLYDSTLEFRSDDENHMKIMSPTLFVRLRQEMAASRINKLLYASTSRKFADGAATTYMHLENDRMKEERENLDGVDKGTEELHHRAVSLHLHLYSFFNSEPRLERRDDLLDLYYAATGFLQCVFELQAEDKLKYVPFYIMQMSLAAGFALLKLLNSEFSARLPFDQGRNFVLKTIDAMRKSKVMPNDLLDRLAEVLAQLWKESSRGRSSLHSMSQSPVVGNSNISMFNMNPQSERRESNGMLEDPLGLIIRSRMSMSVVFDCVWRWRESQVSGAAEQLDAKVVNNPTNADSSGNETPPPDSLAAENSVHTLSQFNPHLNTLSMPLQLPNGLMSANSFEIFDPVSWMLESQTEWGGFGGTFGQEFGA